MRYDHSTFARLSFYFLFSILYFTAPAFSLGVVGTSVVTPNANLANSIVRVSGSSTGTGVIISITSAGTAGNWYTVLTADHVVRDDSNNLLSTGIRIGWGNGNTFPLSVASASNVASAQSTGADLAMFAILVPQNRPAGVPAPADILVPTLPGKNANFPAKNDNIVQAGFGEMVTPGFNEVIILGQPNTVEGYTGDGSFGTLLTGQNTIKDLPVVTKPSKGNVTYNFGAITGTFALTSQGLNYTAGTTYTFPGDSGGPTFENISANAATLVGIHAFATFNQTTDGHNFAAPGNNWNDVNLAYSPGSGQFPYLDWITNTRPTIIPEPTTLSLLALPLFLLRRKPCICRS
jgi:hypothetical protein